MARSDEERAALEAEVVRRYEPDGLVRRAGDIGREMVAVIDAVGRFEHDQRQAVHHAYETIVPDVVAAGLREEWEKVFTYQRPFPEHPGDLYSIDPWCRAAFAYAVLVADPGFIFPGGVAPDSPTTVGRSASGMVMALSVDLATREGWYHPVRVEVAGWLRRPWEMARPVVTSTQLDAAAPAQPDAGAT